MDAIGLLVSATLARQESQQALEREGEFSQNLLSSLDALVLVLDDIGQIMHSNGACQKLSGFAAEELAGRSFWSALAVPEEVEELRAAFDRLLSGDSPQKLESQLLTKTAERRRLSWTFTAIEDPQGKKLLVGTGIEAGQPLAFPSDASRGKGQGKPAVPAVERLLQAPEFDRRASPRRVYPYMQLIAPFVGNKLPPPAAFREVRCRDIAPGGFSFLAAEPPDHEALIVAFGAGNSLMYLRAQIVHITRSAHDGRRMYVVGCRYTGRVRY